MTEQRFAIWQDLLVDGVTVDDGTLSVQLRDRHGQRNFVHYPFPDHLERLQHYDILKSWQSARVPLTYIRTAAGGTLVDDEAVFWQAYT